MVLMSDARHGEHTSKYEQTPVIVCVVHVTVNHFHEVLAIWIRSRACCIAVHNVVDWLHCSLRLVSH
jgi:hypothetical protein